MVVNPDFARIVIPTSGKSFLILILQILVMRDVARKLLSAVKHQMI